MVTATQGSFESAANNIDSILHKICQKKWEQEVIEKKAKPHACEWVFSQAQDLYFIRPDPNRVNTQHDQDADDEPVRIYSLSKLSLMLYGFAFRIRVATTGTSRTKLASRSSIERLCSRMI